MIELEVVDENDFRQVVKKLRTFVEESGVVFVAFEDYVFGGVKGASLGEVFGNASDEIGRVFLCAGENPG